MPIKSTTVGQMSVNMHKCNRKLSGFHEKPAQNGYILTGYDWDSYILNQKKK